MVPELQLIFLKRELTLLKMVVVADLQEGLYNTVSVSTKIGL